MPSMCHRFGGCSVTTSRDQFHPESESSRSSKMTERGMRSTIFRWYDSPSRLASSGVKSVHQVNAKSSGTPNDTRTRYSGRPAQFRRAIRFVMVSSPRPRHAEQAWGEISLAASANIEVTIRRFAQGNDVPGETGEARRSERLLAFAAEAEPHLGGADGAAWMDRLESDHAGLQAAFSWFLRHRKGAEALQLAADMWAFQEERGRADEARAWLTKALAAPGAESRTVTRARALYGAGILAFRKLDEDAARRSFEECLAIARERDYVHMIVRSTTGMARLALRRGDTREVRRLSEEGLAVARERGEKADAVNPLHMLAAAARVEGDLGQAKAVYRENLALKRGFARPDFLSAELENLGALEVLDGNISEAVPLLRESLEMAHKRGDRYLAPYGLVWLGRVAFGRWESARAAELFSAAKAEFVSTGSAVGRDGPHAYEKGLTAMRA